MTTCIVKPTAPFARLVMNLHKQAVRDMFLWADEVYFPYKVRARVCNVRTLDTDCNKLVWLLPAHLSFRYCDVPRNAQNDPIPFPESDVQTIERFQYLALPLPLHLLLFTKKTSRCYWPLPSRESGEKWKGIHPDFLNWLHKRKKKPRALFNC